MEPNRPGIATRWIRPKVLLRSPPIGGEEHCDSCLDRLLPELPAGESIMPARLLLVWVSGDFRVPFAAMHDTRAHRNSWRERRGTSMGFVQNFDSGNGRIVRDGFKGKIQLPLRCGLQVMEGFR